MIKPVDFHHFGKEYINVKVTLITESASEFFPCSLASAIYILIWTVSLLANITRYGKCKGDLTLGKDSHPWGSRSTNLAITLNSCYILLSNFWSLWANQCIMIMLTLSRDQPNENIKTFWTCNWRLMLFVLTFHSLDIIQGPPLVACSNLLVHKVIQNIFLHTKKCYFHDKL